MPGPYDPYRKPEDVGAESPASGSAKEQSIAGARGGPRQARQRGKGKQPAQTSGRRSARHHHRPTARKSFAPHEDPDLQGTGRPRPGTLREDPSLRGIDAHGGAPPP
ncbi:MAG: hypothetical protein FWJ74_12005 [Gemmatimonadota bacterium]